MTRPKKHIAIRKKNLSKCIEDHQDDNEKSYQRTRTGVVKRLVANFENIMNRSPGKLYRRVIYKNEFAHVIKHIIDHTRPLAQCTHFFVGSSLVTQLLKSELTPRDTHAFYNTQSNRKLGSIAEQFVEEILGYGKADCRASHQLPFLCATPDIVMPDRTIEIKNAPNVTPRILLQALIAMEIFDKPLGEILLFETTHPSDELSNEKRPETLNSDVSSMPIPAERDTKPNLRILGVVGLTRTEPLFDDDFIEYTCTGYIHYLLLCFNMMGKVILPEIIYECKRLLILHAHKNTRGSASIGAFHTTPFCERFLTETFDKTFKTTDTQPLWKNAKRTFQASLKKQQIRADFCDKRLDKPYWSRLPLIRDIYSQYETNKGCANMSEKDFIEISGRKPPATPKLQPAYVWPNTSPTPHTFHQSFTFDKVTFKKLVSECISMVDEQSQFPYKTWDVVYVCNKLLYLPGDDKPNDEGR